MDLIKRYETRDGVKCHILHLVKTEPEWAANIIQYYEQKLAEAAQKPNDLLKEMLDDWDRKGWGYNITLRLKVESYLNQLKAEKEIVK